MASNLHQMVLIRWLLKANKFNRLGFTLTELMVSMVMAAIIIGSLLYLVVELLGVNNREEALTQAQQDMQRAIDYITRDASEAVYVYSTPSDVTGQLDDEPAGTPILAFWRLDPIDISSLGTCSGLTGIAKNECDALRIRHNAYTLVLYVQQANSAKDIWQGETRIIRYELPKYKDVAKLDQTPGYADPSLEHPDYLGNEATYEDHGFATWLKDNGETTAGSSAVLTDYVDAINTATTACPSNSYMRTPAVSDSFFSCVRTGDIVVNQLTSRTNQSLVVFLTGNVSGKDAPVLFGPTSEASRTPTLRSEVLIRGVLEKQPD